jgi:hypothetical protein
MEITFFDYLSFWKDFFGVFTFFPVAFGLIFCLDSFTQEEINEEQ